MHGPIARIAGGRRCINAVVDGHVPLRREEKEEEGHQQEEEDDEEEQEELDVSSSQASDVAKLPALAIQVKALGKNPGGFCFFSE